MAFPVPSACSALWERVYSTHSHQDPVRTGVEAKPGREWRIRSERQSLGNPEHDPSKFITPETQHVARGQRVSQGVMPVLPSDVIGRAWKLILPG